MGGIHKFALVEIAMEIVLSDYGLRDVFRSFNRNPCGRGCCRMGPSRVVVARSFRSVENRTAWHGSPIGYWQNGQPQTAR